MKLLLAEDDENLQQSLTRRLRENGFDVDACADGEDALYLAQSNVYDCLLLDRMLPHMDGAEVVRTLRESGSSVPVILITALGTLRDKLTGLNLGADDYLVKPFAFEELLARITCVTRRSPVLHMKPILEVGNISYDPADFTLTGPAGHVTLSRREGALLSFFLANVNQTLERGTLLLRVWGADSDVEDGNLDNYIHFLRRRLDAVGSAPVLRTIRGVGYQLYVS